MMATFQGQAEAVVQNAAPHEGQALRDFLKDAFGALSQSGRDPKQVTQQAGAGNAEPHEMTAAQLASTTLQLTRQHPDIVRSIGERFPQAQPLLSMIIAQQIGYSGQPAGVEGGLQELAGLINR